MITRIFDVRDISEDYAQLNEKLAEAAEILAAGGTVAFPTETVYGLGANALDETAVAKIYEAKGRPSDNPLIVHIASEDQLDGIVREVPEKARAVMAACWPGPISIIMKKDPRVPDRVTAGLDTVAIRMPENPEARVLLSRCGCPVAAPSANLSGKPSPTRPEHVLHDLEGRVDGIVLGRNCDVGIESTVLDLSTEPPVILRPGIVTAEDLNALIGEVRVASNSTKNENVPKAPGMKYTHYAPEAPLILYRGTGDALWQTIRDRAESELAAGRRVGLMLSSEHLNAARETFGNSPDCRIHDLGSIREPKQAAQLIFDILRSLDREGVDLILGETFEEAGVGFSVMNRLTKAATEVIEIEAYSQYNTIKEANMKLVLASDHGGYELKEEIKKHLLEKGYDLEDIGTHSTESVDYPEFGRAAAEMVAAGKADKGILCCGTGIGISLAANKVKGIRCAVVSDTFSAKMSRAHNDANMLSLGGRVVGAGLALEIVDIWLATEFEGGRHQRRVDKIEG